MDKLDEKITQRLRFFQEIDNEVLEESNISYNHYNNSNNYSNYINKQPYYMINNKNITHNFDGNSKYNNNYSNLEYETMDSTHPYSSNGCNNQSNNKTILKSSKSRIHYDNNEDSIENEYIYNNNTESDNAKYNKKQSVLLSNNFKNIATSNKNINKYNKRLSFANKPNYNNNEDSFSKNALILNKYETKNNYTNDQTKQRKISLLNINNPYYERNSDINSKYDEEHEHNIQKKFNSLQSMIKAKISTTTCSLNDIYAFNPPVKNISNGDSKKSRNIDMNSNKKKVEENFYRRNSKGCKGDNSRSKTKSRNKINSNVYDINRNYNNTNANAYNSNNNQSRSNSKSYLNYCTANHDFSFKPHISMNSHLIAEKMIQENRKKPLVDLHSKHSKTKSDVFSTQFNSNSNYFEKLNQVTIDQERKHTRSKSKDSTNSINNPVKLYDKGINHKLKKERFIEKQQEILIAKEMDFTFKPLINENSSKLIKSNHGNNNLNTYDRSGLDSLKKRQFKINKIKTEMQKDFEKYCSFNPDTSKERLKEDQRIIGMNIDSINKYVGERRTYLKNKEELSQPKPSKLYISPGRVLIDNSRKEKEDINKKMVENCIKETKGKYNNNSINYNFINNCGNNQYSNKNQRNHSRNKQPGYLNHSKNNKVLINNNNNNFDNKICNFNNHERKVSYRSSNSKTRNTNNHNNPVSINIQKNYHKSNKSYDSNSNQIKKNRECLNTIDFFNNDYNKIEHTNTSSNTNISNSNYQDPPISSSRLKYEFKESKVKLMNAIKNFKISMGNLQS